MNTDLFGHLFDDSVDDSQRQHAHLTFRGNVQQGRHRWLRLTPAYSLHVVQEILEDRVENELVLDPFSGTGTTPLASAVLGIPAHSVDINPFLVWLGNVKLRVYDMRITDAIRFAARRCCEELTSLRHATRVWIPELHQIDKWWDHPMREALAILFACIEHAIGHQEPMISDLLKVAFCRVMIETSHVSFGHQSMSFKKRSGEKQQALLQAIPISDARTIVRTQFLTAIEELAESLVKEQPIAPAQVFLGDARELERVLPERGYTKVVTSPPYPNRMSYIRELRPYMYWLNFLTNGRQAGELDWAAIGGTWGCATSNLNSWQPDPEQDIPYPQFDRIVASISKDHKLLGRYVHKYFQDMKAHLRSLRRVMAPGGRCYYIVGNSKFYGTLLPVEEIYAVLFEDSGFITPRIKRLRKRNSKKELYEYVVYAEVQPSSNIGLQPTAYSVRSSVAPASGSG